MTLSVWYLCVNELKMTAQDMLANFAFPTPSLSRESLRMMNFDFFHACVIGIFDMSGYQPDLLVKQDRDELKFEGRRDEEKFLMKIAAAVAYDLGTIDPDPNSAETDVPEDHGRGLLPGLDVYHVCVGDLRLDTDPHPDFVDIMDKKKLSPTCVCRCFLSKELSRTARWLLATATATATDETFTDVYCICSFLVCTDRYNYLTKDQFEERYSTVKRYNHAKDVEDPAKARLFLQYLCLAAGEVRTRSLYCRQPACFLRKIYLLIVLMLFQVTSTNKRMHCPRRPNSDGDMCTHQEFLF